MKPKLRKRPLKEETDDQKTIESRDCYIPRVETNERECWKFLDWRLASENESLFDGQPSFVSSLLTYESKRIHQLRERLQQNSAKNMKIVQCLSSSLDSSATSSKNCGTKGHMIPKENLFKIKLYSSGVLVSTTVKRGVLRLQTMRPKLPQDN